MLPAQRLEALIARHAELEAALSTSTGGENFVKLSREHAELSPVIEDVKALKQAQDDLAGAEQLLSGGDPEMARLAADEKRELETNIEALTQKLRLALIPKDEADARDAILEVRAGTGGDEASLFAGDLFRMYERYAVLQGWKVEVMSVSEGAVGGYKEIIAAIRGKGAFARLKFESGVHRVQRVPDTETQGRIHTSAATVAVLPEAEEVDVDINAADLRTDVYRASGSGGQHVNKTESAVRITHIPTGIVVAVQDERSQHKNRARAMALLRTKLYDQERQRIDSTRAADRKSKVGSGDRSERIRTYNFPQARVTDHRINLTLHKLPQIMEGVALGEIVNALIAEHQAALLADEESKLSA